MLRPLLIVLLLSSLITGGALHAQTNFEPGYLVTISGDTLRGELDARGEEMMSRRVSLRSGGTTEVFGPKDVQRFAFTGGTRYRSKIIDGRRNS